MADFFSGIGIGGTGKYPPSQPGVVYVVLPSGGATYTNALGTQFSASQILKASTADYSYFFRTQDPGSLVGDGNIYLFDGGSGWKLGSLSAGFQAYGGYEGNGVVITNLSIIVAGSATLAGTNIGCHIDSGGPMDQAVAGSQAGSSVTVLFPKNTVLAPADGTVLSAGSLGSTTVTIVSSASCGTSGFTFGILSGALPTGVVLNTATGALTGTPTSSGAWSVTIYAQKVSGSTYCWGTATYSGYSWVGGGPTAVGGSQIAGSGIGPQFINAFPPQWQIHQFDLKQRKEETS